MVGDAETTLVISVLHNILNDNHQKIVPEFIEYIDIANKLLNLFE